MCHLGEDGLVLGSYELYDSNSLFVGSRAFMFTMATGVQDLGFSVDSSFANWSHLSSAIRANSIGNIIGQGVMQDGNTMAFMLTPSAVPEPSGLLLVGLGIGMLSCRRWRR